MLWKELQERGFTGGYKMVNIWVREYLQQPGRQSSEREKARRQLFLLPPLTEPVFEGGQHRTDFSDTSEEQTLAVLLEEPLPSPRRLVWLLLRNAESLTEAERQVLSFICLSRVFRLSIH